MSDLPTDWGALCALAFVLGLKHGLDADHLATVDGLARLASLRGGRRARWSGVSFSLGHGAVVVGIVLALGALRAHWQVPAWLDATGAAISLTFLLALGVANLGALMSTPAHAVVRPVAIRGRWLGRWLHSAHPLAPALVGALFAFSFDTVGQAALFAVAGSSGGAHSPLLLALLFVAGMLVTDGINGWWIARLLAGADRTAALVSRVMGGCVAAVSLVVGAAGAARWLSPRLEAWLESHAAASGLVVCGVVALCYAAACLLARRRRAVWAS